MKTYTKVEAIQIVKNNLSQLVDINGEEHNEVHLPIIAVFETALNGTIINENDNELTMEHILANYMAAVTFTINKSMK
jgi:hypothetical protein